MTGTTVHGQAHADVRCERCAEAPATFRVFEHRGDRRERLVCDRCIPYFRKLRFETLRGWISWRRL